MPVNPTSLVDGQGKFPRNTIDILSQLLEDEGIPATIGLSAEGEKQLQIKKGPLRFYFTSMDFVFAARADLQANSGYLRITGDLGTLPYSVQSPLLRRCFLTVIKQQRLMRHCRLQVRQKSNVILSGGIAFKGIRHQSILAALVRLLLDCRPHLSLFQEYQAFLPQTPHPQRISAKPG